MSGFGRLVKILEKKFVYGWVEVYRMKVVSYMGGIKFGNESN